MKNLFIAVFLLAIPIASFAQINEVNHFYRKYKRQEAVRNFTVPGVVFRIGGLFSKRYTEDPAEAKAIRKLSKRMRSVRFLIMEDQNLVKKEDYNKVLSGAKSKNNFNDLFKVSSEGTRVNFLLKEGKRGKKQLLMFVSEEDTFVMMRFKMKLKKDDLKTLISILSKEAEIKDPTEVIRRDQA